MSAGDFARAMADKMRISLDEFEIRAQKDFALDSEIDIRTLDFGQENGSFVFDGRMAWQAVPSSLKILLICEDEVRFRRIADHRGMTFERAREQTLMREKSIRDRFSRWYRISRFDDPIHFDIVIDTTRSSPGEVVEKIIKAMIERSYVIVPRSHAVV